MKQRYCLIVNETSGSGRAGSVIRSHWKKIKEELDNPEILFISRPGSLTEEARKAASYFQFVIACGGDGTINSIARGLLGTDAILGVLPLGSGNDFSKTLGLKKTIIENLDILKTANTRNLDVVQCNDMLFINTFGLGFDGYTNYLASKSLIPGTFRYIFAGLKTLAVAKAFQAEINFEEFHIHQKVMMIIVANGTTEGGKYLVSAGSRNNDGVAELVIVPEMNRLQLAFEFLNLSIGNTFFSKSIFSKRIRRGSIHLETSEYAHADGEVVKADKDMEISVLPDALSVIISTP